MKKSLVLNLDVQKLRIIIYHLICWLIEKKWYKKSRQLYLPLKWSVSNSLDKGYLKMHKDAVVVLIGVFQNSGHLMGGCHYGGNYYKPYSVNVRYLQKKVNFPISAGGQTIIYAVVMPKEELSKFKLLENIRAENGLNTHATPIKVRPFYTAKLKRTIKKISRSYGQGHSWSIDFSSDFFRELQCVWK